MMIPFTRAGLSVAVAAAVSAFSMPMAVQAADAAPANAGESAATAVKLAAVVVTATRSEQPITDVVADVSLIDRSAIERSGATSVAEVLQRVGGVTFNTNGGPASTTSVYIRGAETRFTAVFIDGVRIDSQSTGGATWQGIPLSEVERIEVLRGPAAAIYGSDAMAGVVQIFTREGKEGFHPSVRFAVGSNGTREVGASLRGGVEGLTYSLGLSREKSDGFNIKEDGNSDKDGYDRENFSGRLGWQINEQHRLNLSALSSRLEADYDGYTPGEDDVGTQKLQTLGAEWAARWTDTYSTKLSLSQGTDEYSTDPSPYSTKTDISSYLLRNEWRMGAATLTADLERREDKLNNDSTIPAKSERTQDGLALGYGLRSGLHTLQLNVRRDDDSEFGVHNTGSVAYGYQINEQWQATASAGTAFRAPTLFQRFSIYGDAGLKAEEARNFEAGVRFRQGVNRFKAVAYRNNVKNLIEYVAGEGSCINGSGTYAGCYGNTGRARYTGVSLEGGTRFGNVNVGVTLDIMDPKNLETGKQLARRAKTQGGINADTTIAGWTLGGELLVVGERYNDAANTQKLDAYEVVNLSVSKRLTQQWKLVGKVNNVFDKDYQSVLGYNTEGRALYVGLNWELR